MNLTLNNLYEGLDFHSGELVGVDGHSIGQITHNTDDERLNREKWIESCRRINLKSQPQGFVVESLFFVQNNPVAIFAKIDNNDDATRRIAFRTLWNLARPRYLFLVYPAETEVFDLSEKQENLNEPKPLVAAKEIGKLLRFRRDVLESGDEQTKSKAKRYTADAVLIRDLKALRRMLTDAPYSLNLDQAHTLIAQVIFIRYLEDRQILEEDYFRGVAGTNEVWNSALLETTDAKRLMNPELADRFFPRILADRDFSIELFKQLTRDFNGDVFRIEEDYSFVQALHLRLIQQFLWSDMEQQQKIFLWAYQFDVIPLELISSIYEEFYHTTNPQDEAGTHYTPSSLVDFLLSRTLTPERLKNKPVILDPACGSGIFLVESFRRIVRHRQIFEGLKPSFESLTAILGQQIRGIELNPHAARITAFSLYIALLDFLDPPHIRHYIEQEGKKLPNLLYSQMHSERHLNILLDKNAFWVDDLFNQTQDEGLAPFRSGVADIVVGNPPWGSPKADDIEGREALDIALNWAKRRKLPLPDKERSRLFILRTEDLLKPGGVSGLLISSGVLFNASDGAARFRLQWASNCSLLEVFNFINVRRVFFSKAISPFLGVVFQKAKPSARHLIYHWTLRQTRFIRQNQVVVLDSTDFKVIPQSWTRVPDVWKIHWFGNQLDFALISGLRMNPPLQNWEKKQDGKRNRRQGFIEAKGKSKKVESGWLSEFQELPTDFFNNKYGQIDFTKVLKPVPDFVKERGNPENYDHDRILIKRGIDSEGENTGKIVARYEEARFAFRHSINCFRIEDEKKGDSPLLIGILWSLLAKYYYFFTSSEWGVWHDEINPSELLALPIPERDSDNAPFIKKITSIVTALRQIGNADELFQINEETQIRQLETELDKAVFDLYYLTGDERDLIRDRCRYDIGYYYDKDESEAMRQVLGFADFLSGTIEDVKSSDKSPGSIHAYLDALYDTVTPLLKKDTTISHTVVRSRGLNSDRSEWADLVAVVFNLNEGEKAVENAKKQLRDWQDVIKLLHENARQDIEQSVRIEHFVRIVSQNYLFIVKRNERRLWSRTAAREDARALFVQSQAVSPQTQLVPA